MYEAMTRLIRLLGSLVLVVVFLPLLVLGGLVVMGFEGVNRMFALKERS